MIPYVIRRTLRLFATKKLAEKPTNVVTPPTISATRQLNRLIIILAKGPVI